MDRIVAAFSTDHGARQLRSAVCYGAPPYAWSYEEVPASRVPDDVPLDPDITGVGGADQIYEVSTLVGEVISDAVIPRHPERILDPLARTLPESGTCDLIVVGLDADLARAQAELICKGWRELRGG